MKACVASSSLLAIVPKIKHIPITFLPETLRHPLQYRKAGGKPFQHVGQQVGTVCPLLARQHSSNITGKQICENNPLQEVFLKIPSHCIIVLQAVSKFKVFILTRLKMERKLRLHQFLSPSNIFVYFFFFFSFTIRGMLDIPPNMASPQINQSILQYYRLPILFYFLWPLLWFYCCCMVVVVLWLLLLLFYGCCCCCCCCWMLLLLVVVGGCWLLLLLLLLLFYGCCCCCYCWLLLVVVGGWWLVVVLWLLVVVVAAVGCYYCWWWLVVVGCCCCCCCCCFMVVVVVVTVGCCCWWLVVGGWWLFYGCWLL